MRPLLNTNVSELLTLLAIISKTVAGRRLIQCKKVDSLGGGEENSGRYAVKDGSMLALRLEPGYDSRITHNVNFYLWDHSQMESRNAYISRIGLFNAWPWMLVSYHRQSEIDQQAEMSSPPPMGQWMVMQFIIREGQAAVILTVRDGESYYVTTPVPDGKLYLSAGRRGVLTPAYQVAWGCRTIDNNNTDIL